MYTQVGPNKETTQVPEYTVDETPTIYVVDPDEKHCSSVSALMRRLGYATECFSSAEEFLDSRDKLARKACVISEMQLPGMNGLDLYTNMLEQKLALPFIILTKDSDVTRAVGALHRKVADYIVKPVVERALIRRVRDALRKLDDGRVKTLG